MPYLQPSLCDLEKWPTLEWSSMDQTIPPTMKNLRFRYIFGDEDAIIIGSLIRNNTTLVTVDLAHNEISVVGAIALKLGLQHNFTLKHLSINENVLGDDGVAALGMNNLCSLNLSYNGIGEVGATAIAFFLQLNTTLTDLYLCRNALGAGGASALAEALLQNCTLTDFYLASTQIGDAGCIALSGCLHINTTLTHLDLSYNHIGLDGAQALRTALQMNSSLLFLDIDRNDLNDEGAIAIAQGLQLNDGLRKLYMRWNNVHGEGVRAIYNAMQLNTTLQTLSIDFFESFYDHEFYNLTSCNTKLFSLKYWHPAIHLNTFPLSVHGMIVTSLLCGGLPMIIWQLIFSMWRRDDF